MGTVTDQTGGVVPGASVQLKDDATGVAKDTVANEIGIFNFPDLNFRSELRRGQVRITGGIPGTVTDMSDAVVPGAAVLLMDEGTDIMKETRELFDSPRFMPTRQGCAEIGGTVV